MGAGVGCTGLVTFADILCEVTELQPGERMGRGASDALPKQIQCGVVSPHSPLALRDAEFDVHDHRLFRCEVGVDRQSQREPAERKQHLCSGQLRRGIAWAEMECVLQRRQRLRVAFQRMFTSGQLKPGVGEPGFNPDSGRKGGCRLGVSAGPDQRLTALKQRRGPGPMFD